MDVVSYETAKRLKAAGFPHPEPEFGQMWYDESQEMRIVNAVFKHPLAHYAHTGNEHGYITAVDFNKFEAMCYAPTASDIFSKLPDLCVVLDGDMYAQPGDMSYHESAKSLPEFLAAAYIDRKADANECRANSDAKSV